MFFWKPGNACGGGERKGKVMKTLDFYYASGKKEGPAQGALTRRENVSGRLLSREKSLRHAYIPFFVFAAQADWMTTACILAGNPL